MNFSQVLIASHRSVFFLPSAERLTENNPLSLPNLPLKKTGKRKEDGESKRHGNFKITFSKTIFFFFIKKYFCQLKPRFFSSSAPAILQRSFLSLFPDFKIRRIWKILFSMLITFYSEWILVFKRFAGGSFCATWQQNKTTLWKNQ